MAAIRFPTKIIGKLGASDRRPIYLVPADFDDCGTICAPSLMAVVGQYVQWAGKAGRRMPRLLSYWLMHA